MAFKNRLIVLLSLICALSLIYIASFVFSPERRGAMSASYVWLDQKLAERTSRIVIDYQGGNLQFFRDNNQWFVTRNGIDYPARQLRVEDFIGILTERAAWDIRSSNASAHARFGLDAGAASRIIIYGENTILLDLLLGLIDNSGHIYARKNGENEVRSGEYKIYSYLAGSAAQWFNLRLFPESENGSLDADDVQRLSVYNNGETQIFSRVNRAWDLTVTSTFPIVSVSSVNISQPMIDSYIRNVLNSEGDDFLDTNVPADIDFNYSRIVIEFGNGKISTIRFSEPDENDRRYAVVDGSGYIYSIPAWAVFRIFRETASFDLQ